MRKTILKNAVLYLGIAFYSLSTVATLPALAEFKNGLQNGLKNEERETFPGQRVGGGTRGGRCESSGNQLIALNPSNNLGVTSRKQPLLYIAVPELNKLYPANFYIKDENENIIYETTLEVGINREFVEIRLPENLLKIGQDYKWDFSIHCNFDKDNDLGDIVEIFVQGTLRQVLPEIPLKIELTLEEGLAITQSYQEAGLWSDAIAASIELRRTHPNSDRVRDQWRQLLYALDFDNNEAILETLLEIQVPELQASE